MSMERVPRSFDVDEDCRFIKEILEGLDRTVSQKELTESGSCSRTTELVRLFTHRTLAQRAEIIDAYKSTYKVYLVALVKEKTTPGPVQEGLLTLLRPAAVNDAIWINKAIAGIGTDKKILVDILCTRSVEEIEEMKVAYKEMFTEELGHALGREFSLGIKVSELFMALLTAARSTAPARKERAKEIAEELRRVTQGCIGSSHEVFVRIFARESLDMLKSAFHTYENMFGSIHYDLTKNLWISRTFVKALQTIVQHAESPYGFVAIRIHKALCKSPVNVDFLYRSILKRSHSDISRIKEEYFNKYHVPLHETIVAKIGDRPIVQLLLFAIDEGGSESD